MDRSNAVAFKYLFLFNWSIATVSVEKEGHVYMKDVVRLVWDLEM